MTISELRAAGKLSFPPDPEWVRGTCPKCGAEVISTAIYVKPKGYVIIWICWNALADSPTCNYTRTL